MGAVPCKNGFRVVPYHPGPSALGKNTPSPSQVVPEIVFHGLHCVSRPAHQRCVWRKGGGWPRAQGAEGGGFQKQCFPLENTPNVVIRGVLPWKRGYFGACIQLTRCPAPFPTIPPYTSAVGGACMGAIQCKNGCRAVPYHSLTVSPG